MSRMLVPGDDSNVEIARLKARILVLELEVDTKNQLIDAIINEPEKNQYGWHFPPEWNLTRYENQIARLLISKRRLSKESIFQGMYGGLIDQPEMKIIDVLVCKVRKKVPFTIKTVWGFGYEVPSDEVKPLQQYFIAPPTNKDAA